MIKNLNDWEFYFWLLVPVYLIGAFTISGWLYEIVMDLYMRVAFYIWKWRNNDMKTTN